jgi:hypothetical protein
MCSNGEGDEGNGGGGDDLGWEIRSEFHGIPQLFGFWTFSNLEFSLEFHFSDHKICSRQFGTGSHQFRILSRHQVFQFRASENIPAFFLGLPKLHLLVLSRC